MFLYLESRETMMHVAGLLQFSPPPDAPSDHLRRLVDELRASPRVQEPWNLKLRTPDLLVNPLQSWVEDKRFDYLAAQLADPDFIDDQVMSFDAYTKFVEDDFLGGQRIDPLTDGRPDPRPDVREAVLQVGDLRRDFNFSQRPRSPLLLPTHPRPGPASQP